MEKNIIHTGFPSKPREVFVENGESYCFINGIKYLVIKGKMGDFDEDEINCFTISNNYHTLQ